MSHEASNIKGNALKVLTPFLSLSWASPFKIISLSILQLSNSSGLAYQAKKFVQLQFSPFILLIHAPACLTSFLSLPLACLSFLLLPSSQFSSTTISTIAYTNCYFLLRLYFPVTLFGCSLSDSICIPLWIQRRSSLISLPHLAIFFSLFVENFENYFLLAEN